MLMIFFGLIKCFVINVLKGVVIEVKFNFFFVIVWWVLVDVIVFLVMLS